MRTNRKPSAQPQASREARSLKDTRPARRNIYDEVTARICAELAEGRLPWVQPWGTKGTGSACLPCNAVTGKPYSGINVLLLWGAENTDGEEDVQPLAA